ncbi:MAG: T9SS type A sorting domain-containing protein [Saprospiraceae bacterium]|nr:T9SS type A sorting domain-containing protein [Bacteroidia bacterium]NNE13510.1 T9SS type A sorting domain-containing protein [Saprospiraceae bacterium]NNL92574.1 T9SS type A sorting domain-containing protein [Saprospiraceae bacterium]
MKALFTLIFLCTGIFYSNAQEILAVTGGDAFGNGGSSSYTVGQQFFGFKTDGTNTVIEGIQHPIEISVITGTENDLVLNLNLSVYPNPTAQLLNLEIIDYNKEKLKFQLFDFQGKLIDDQFITGSITKIFLGNLIPSTYLLKVVDQNQSFKSFKIVKN